MIFVFIVILSGLWTLHRTLNLFVEERFLARNKQHLIIFLVISAQFVLMEVFSGTYFGVWFQSILPFCASKSAFKMLTYIRGKQFKDLFGQLLDEIIIEMRSGQSFRISLSAANEKMPPFVQQKVRKVIELVRFKSSIKDIRDVFVVQVVEEFRRVDENTHNSMQRILSLRNKIRAENDYRRRSGQVVLQIRAQAAILVVLYIATAIFVLLQTPVENILRELTVSLTLFFIGTAIVFLYGRTYKWKV